MKLVHSTDLPWADALVRGLFQQRRKALGGGERLRCSVFELPPGKRSFPLHAHLVTEEAMFVLSGRAKVRTLEGLTELGPGDFVAFPAGGPAHQLLNEGTEPLVYLAMSAGVGADVVQYPDSKKIPAAVGAPPTGKRWVFREGEQAVAEPLQDAPAVGLDRRHHQLVVALQHRDALEVAAHVEEGRRALDVGEHDRRRLPLADLFFKQASRQKPSSRRATDIGQRIAWVRRCAFS